MLVPQLLLTVLHGRQHLATFTDTLLQITVDAPHSLSITVKAGATFLSKCTHLPVKTKESMSGTSIYRQEERCAPVN